MCAWRGDFGEARTLLPDECVDMYWVGGSVWVSGPETRSWPSSAWPSSGAVGVRFRSGVAPSLLRVAASELRDARVRLDQLWEGRAARELAERIGCRDDDDGRAAELETAVRQMAAGGWSLDVVAQEVTDMLRTARTASARSSRGPFICPSVSSSGGALPRSGTGLSFCCGCFASSASCSWLVVGQDRHAWPAWRSMPAMPTSLISPVRFVPSWGPRPRSCSAARHNV
jgi:hypothetical protein